MPKHFHEIRDPVHNFVKLDSDERKVLNSPPVQRLRDIHQLAFTYLVYPGATHRRFEHSLGVMELASRVFDIVTDEKNIHSDCRDFFPDRNDLGYWRRVLRMAALCHDIGHMPFSHAGEGLLPKGMTHETITDNLIKSPEMDKIWHSITPPLRAEEIAKLALGPKELKDTDFSIWETILSEIITGNAFGVDRIDYLLRDSLHAGVAYGKFDHYRLIDTLRILPKDEESGEPTLGVEEGGLHSAESLILARHFMFTQLYCHHVRRSYDIHLVDFLKAWLPEGKYPLDLPTHLRTTDTEVMTAIRNAFYDKDHPGNHAASCILTRGHYRLFYRRVQEDVNINPDASREVYQVTCDKFGKDNLRLDKYSKNAGVLDFPVLTNENRIRSSWMLSQILHQIPPVGFEYVFIAPQLKEKALKWLEANRNEIIRPISEEEEQ